jgi:hypothetical protein
MAFHYEPSLGNIVHKANAEAAERTKDIRLASQKRSSGYIDSIQKNRGGMLIQRHDNRMMTVMFAADMVLDCKQRGSQAYVHWHGPRGDQNAPRLPKSMCRIMQEFLPWVRSELGALVHWETTKEEYTSDTPSREAQRLKKAGRSEDEPNPKRSTHGSPQRASGSRKRPLSYKDKGNYNRRQHSEVSKTEHLGWGGWHTSIDRSVQGDRSIWTPQLRPQETGRHRSREPRGKPEYQNTWGNPRQRNPPRKAPGARSSYSPRSRHSDYRYIDTGHSSGNK